MTRPGWLLKSFAPTAIIKVVSAINIAIESYCEGCTAADTECQVTCRPIDVNSCTIIMSPYHSPCITSSGGTGLFNQLGGAMEYSIKFQVVPSVTYIVHLFLGLFLLTQSTRLRYFAVLNRQTEH